MNRNDQRLLAKTFRESGIFQAIAPSDLRLLETSARGFEFGKPGMLSTGEQSGQELYLVAAGQIELISRVSSGREVTIGAFGPGQIVNWLTIIDPVESTRTFQSARNTRVIAFPAELIRTVMKRNPDAYLPLLLEVGGRFRGLINWIEKSNLLDPKRRLAMLLLTLLRTSGTGHVVNLSQERLAELLRSSRQTTNRLLGQLTQMGFIARRYGGVEIIDLARIRRFVDDE